jgi:hypothetical protein
MNSKTTPTIYNRLSANMPLTDSYDARPCCAFRPANIASGKHAAFCRPCTSPLLIDRHHLLLREHPFATDGKPNSMLRLATADALRPPARWGRPDHSYPAPYCRPSRSERLFNIERSEFVAEGFHLQITLAGLGKRPWDRGYSGGDEKANTNLG